MRSHHLAEAVAACCLTAALLPGVAAIPPVAAAVSSTHDGWSNVPSAARAPILAALRRSESTSRLATTSPHPTLPGAVASQLTAPDGQANDSFGESVATAGNTVVVGDPGRTVGLNLSQGAVYVFTRPKTGWRSLTGAVELTVHGAAGDGLGSSVAIAGTTIVAGAPQRRVNPNAHQGALYVFSEPTSGWVSTKTAAAELTSSADGANANLGTTVAMTGNVIAAGDIRANLHSNVEAGAIDVWIKPAGGWATRQQSVFLEDPYEAPNAHFGQAIAMAGTTIVGTELTYNSLAGRAFVFPEPSDGWTSANPAVREIQPADPIAGGYFGISAAVDGHTVVIGSDRHDEGATEGEGSAYVYTEPPAGWTDPAHPRDATALTQTATLTPADGSTNEGFGVSVAVKGGLVAVGSGQSVGDHSFQGAVYVFAEQTAGWADTSDGYEVSPSAASTASRVGNPLTVGNGTLVAGSPLDKDTGTVFLFAAPGPRLRSVKQSHSSWRLGHQAAKVNPAHVLAGGTRFTIAASAPGRVRLAFAEKNKHGHYVAKGTLTATVKTGTNTIGFDGLIRHGRELTVGHCKVAISISNANGTSTTKTLTFRTKRATHA